MINNYYVYGLNIKSEIEIQEFEKIDRIENKDIVTIRYSKMQKQIKDKISDGCNVQLFKDKIWFHINNIATYCITNGNSIEVEVCENADMQLMKVYIMCRNDIFTKHY